MTIEIFDFNKVEGFNRHIAMSIPNYEQLFSIFLELVSVFSEPETCVIDYGCSAGRLLLELPKKASCKYFGVDVAELLPTSNVDVQFNKADAIAYGRSFNEPVSVVISMFFLQFLGNRKRKEMLKVLRDQVSSGATLLISEKTLIDDSIINAIISRLHVQEKRKNFADDEILNKDRQLLRSMFCRQESELLDELNNIGTVTKVWQSYNFCGYIVK